MANRLEGKVVIVTGASAGIGRASALALAGEGAALVLTARRERRLEEVARAAREAGGRAVNVVGDAREEATAQRAVAAAQESFGRLDILVNKVQMGSA